MCSTRFSATINPPRLSSIVENVNILQPQKSEVDEALEKTRDYWYHLASLAFAYRDHGLTPEHTNPRLTLHRIPKFQGRPRKIHVRPYGVSSIPVLCMQASSTWRLVENSSCDMIEKEITNSALLKIGTSSAIPYSFCGTVFSSWIGTTEESRIGPNYLGILTVAWCYILSARLVEIQGEGASMQCTSSETEGESLYGLQETYNLEVGEADENVTRWWIAILAQHQGWKATVKQTPEGEFLAPWAVSRTCQTRFKIQEKRYLPASVCSPLTSEQAFDALTEFACLHGLGSQLSIALMAAVTFPTPQYYGSTVQLPFPRATGGRLPTAPISLQWPSLIKELSYYMTLSCSPEVVMSTLCGSFWELEVPCNLVGPWLHPILNEVVSGTSGTVDHDYEILALIGAIRRPNIRALWIGAATSGLGPKIIQKVRRGRPPLDALAFPWTGYPQSFTAGSGPYTCVNAEYISRPDVWRLLHLPPKEGDDLCYRNRLCTPWAPCGNSKIKDCALRVTSHLRCNRHEYHFHHWNWDPEEGAIVQDYGFSTTPISTIIEYPTDILDIKKPKPFQKKELDQMASREASSDIFRWFFINGEGKPPESIYEDDWLKEIWDQDESGEEADEAVDQKSQGLVATSRDRVEIWLSSVT
ncbi:unnamed protein product [Penicillium salamii]|uniref:Uncharacterized protein n=1 Tax=Penicillium salamii TaxID=1612424 RepID=A0A9W4NUE7_9EURO|nr:unnamed protein product [Penicillium salamii]CAG8303930.1 unnamed protein product [Penicillium salamii]CAG8367093.1 unnamed protein product [Penicillium salamii]CAG8398810.1 unnamed protein product [Penicillium salamii]CAG8408385.1 unnamed protein product [Penicillium salamii]